EALGTTDWGGVLRGAFSAHPHRVPSRRAHYNFGLRMGRRTRLDFYELPDEGPARHLTGVALARPTMIHDFAVTENHLIAFVPPLTIRLPAFLLGLRPLGRSFAWRPEWGTEVIVVPIDRPREVARFRTEPFWFWHFANAFERGGRLHADVVRVADFSHFAGAEGFTRGERGLGDEGRLTRAEIDPAGRRVRFTRPWERGCDFPRVAPSVEAGPYRYAYVACHGSPAAAKARWFDAVARVDVEAGSADVYVATAGAVLSEPIFAPDPEGEAEDAGWLLVDVHDPARGESGALILDARAIDKGPLASCWYGEPVPLRFHGAWIPT
ncbi:MAG: carotenoid oxygenase family protein, partial [Myxococcales bacterium]|nr:carotenoid oxygenase family protein [Myxococcales bacterium]